MKVILNNSLIIEDINLKIKNIEYCLQDVISGKGLQVPIRPGRDIQVLSPQFHPAKKGLSLKESRARLLHDLANIELQAMELALRTLIEYPEAPEQFQKELIELTLSESQHLKLCLEGIQSLGFNWGDWPIHLALWETVCSQDSLLDRILIVHRFLEGSGLDAQTTLLRRLEGVNDPQTYLILKHIHKEEVDHVLFGSRWYNQFLAKLEIVSSDYLKQRLLYLSHRLPSRREPISHRWRLKAGFTPEEIEVFENFQKDSNSFH